jgi:hypothetical protein
MGRLEQAPIANIGKDAPAEDYFIWHAWADPLLDLQGAVMNCIPDFERISDLVHERISRITLGHYQVDG